MIRKITLTLLLLTVCNFSYAEKYYVFIDKIGSVEKGQEAGQNEKGDIVGIHPFTKQYKPTKAELDRYKVIIMDLTEDNILYLTESDSFINENKLFITTRARKRKVNLDNITGIKQEEEVEKKTLTDNIILKPTVNQ